MNLTKTFIKASKYAALVILAIFAMLPMSWMLLTSIRPPEEHFLSPPTFLVKKPVLDHYLKIFSDIRFVNYFTNSALVAVLTAIVTLLIASLAGYGFSRLRFRSKELLFLSIITCQLIPLMVIIFPIYEMFSQLNLLDNVVALVIPYLILTIPFSTWMSRAVLSSIPRELEEAAMLDGCTTLGALFRIVFPIAAPGLAAIVVFCFIEAWNEYLLALTFLSSVEKRTIQIGIFLFKGEYFTDWGALMAASTLATIPMIILFILIQKYFIMGMAGGIKGS